MTYLMTDIGVEHLVQFQSKLGYSFKNPKILIESFTHKSVLNGQKDRLLECNERLEFLGDAVLDLVMSDKLMDAFPTHSEGDLTKKRASLVNETALSEVALDLELNKYVQMGRAEIEVQMNTNPRILASTLEALIGALYIDGGFEVVKTILDSLFAAKIEKLKMGVSDFEDFKTRLQEIIQKKYHLTPTYNLTGSTGPEHQKIFEVEVLLEGKVLARATGRNKKIAEQNAARIALEELS